MLKTVLHNLEEYLVADLDGACLRDDPSGPLFRTIGRGTVVFADISEATKLISGLDPAPASILTWGKRYETRIGSAKARSICDQTPSVRSAASGSSK
jgi:hypothetical protein